MFSLTEFIVEGLVRDKLEEIRTSEDIDLIMTDIYGTLRDPVLSTKFGNSEITKIKEVIEKSAISVHQGLTNLASNAKLPAFSIHLQTDTEREDLASFDDEAGECVVPVDPEVYVDTFDATNYFSDEARVIVPNSVDLSEIYGNLYYEDGSGLSYRITYPISNVDDNKYFTIDKSDSGPVNLIGGRIVSSIEERIFELKYIPSQEIVMLGAHAENSLLTKYLYYLLRYIMFQIKEDLERRGLEFSKHLGSDFQLNSPLLGDEVYSRFLTLNLVHYDYFRGAEKTIIEAINPAVGGEPTDPTIVDCFVPLAYDDGFGIITVPDSVDLSEVKKDMFFVVPTGAENQKRYQIKGGINNTPGNKQFSIAPNLSITIDPMGCYKIQEEFAIRAGNIGGPQEGDLADRDCGEEMTWTNEKSSDSD